jgi:hypothetical protein
MQLHDTKGKKVILQAYGVPVTNLATANFTLIGNAQFVVKNDNADRVQLEVKYFGTTVFVPTYFQPGWNPDVLIAIKQNTGVSNLLYSV